MHVANIQTCSDLLRIGLALPHLAEHSVRFTVMPTIINLRERAKNPEVRLGLRIKSRSRYYRPRA